MGQDNEKMKLDMTFVTNTKMIYLELNMTDKKLIKMKEVGASQKGQGSGQEASEDQRNHFSRV
jgi:hypothetical protein